jgi:hypothetical protein
MTERVSEMAAEEFVALGNGVGSFDEVVEKIRSAAGLPGGPSSRGRRPSACGPG